MSVLSKPYFHDETAAYAFLEGLLWPNGPTCPHCGSADAAKIGELKGKSTRVGLKKCYACREQFTVKVGTVYESSHVPLFKWLQATFLLTSSKKGISAHQLHRTLGVTYKTAWFMAHRIREGMRLGNVPPLGGEGKAVEADETYIGRKAGTVRKQGTGHETTRWHKGVSIGAVVGQLKLVDDIDDAGEFVIVPAVGPETITCRFPDSMRDAIREFLFKTVRVKGALHYRENSPFPYRVDAEENGIEPYPARPRRRSLSELRGVFSNSERTQPDWDTLLNGR